MINSIKMNNFESHKNTLIELHSGVNVVEGKSDEGKSSIIRAIKWNTQNRPQGNAYRSDSLNEKDKLTEVSINYNEQIITRARDGKSSGINHYQINDNEPLRALRSDVPDEVQDISKIKSVNIQGQHPTEQYFLLADKPGQVAKRFNEVAGLVVMDKALLDINSQVRSCNSKIKEYKNEIKNKLTELEESEWIESAEKMAKKLKGLNERIYKKQTEITILNNHLVTIEKTNKQIQDFQNLDKAIKMLEKLKSKMQSIKDEKSDINTLLNTILVVNDVNSQLKSYTDTDAASKLLKQLVLSNSKTEQLFNEIDDINLLLNKINANQSELKYAERKLADIQKRFNDIRENQNCPVCGRSARSN